MRVGGPVDGGHRAALVVVALGLLLGAVAPAAAAGVNGHIGTLPVSAEAVVLIDLETGKVLFENDNYTFRDQYELSTDPASFFEEDSMAVRRLSADFARTLVSNVLEAF